MAQSLIKEKVLIDESGVSFISAQIVDFSMTSSLKDIGVPLKLINRINRPN